MGLKRLFLTSLAIVLFSMVGEAQGLQFKGMVENTIDKRTSYNVFGNKKVKLVGDINISFDLNTLPPDKFGYYLRITNLDEDDRALNLSYDHAIDSVIVIRLNEEGRYSLIRAHFTPEQFKWSHWYKVNLRIDTVKDSVHLTIGDTTFHAAAPIEDRLSPTIEFGKSQHLIEVPTFAMRDLHIKDSEKEYVFKFNQHKGTTVSDEKGSIHGTVSNPVWLLNQSFQWNHECKSINTTASGATYNPVRKEVYYFSKTGLTTYGVTDGTIVEDVPYKNDCPVRIAQGNSWVTKDGNNLVCYECFNDNYQEGDTMAASLNLDTMVWTPLSKERMWMHMHHHCGFINPQTGKYTVFGGFGRQTYNGTFYEWEGNGWSPIWENHVGDTIFPRYFASSGVSEDGRYIYIYGGMGNECGDQVVGRRYFYDLNRVDTSTGETETLWSFKKLEDYDMAAVFNLIPDGDWFYTLCYPESKSYSELQLYRFNIKDGSHQEMATTINMVSDHILTNANIFLDRELMKFIVTTVVFPDEENSTFDVFTLAYPPISGNEENSSNPVFLILVAILFGCITVGGGFIVAYVFVRRQRKKKEEFDRLYKMKTSHGETVIYKQPSRSNAIYTFGELSIIDRDGKEISAEFTAQMRLILCLIIKYSYDGKGIESNKLSSIIWPDKDIEKIRNSRSVAINNLRKSLRKLDGVKVVFEDGCFRLSIEGGCYCDYFALKEEMTKNIPDKATILNIMSRGQFLKYETDEVLDSFKSRTEDMTITQATIYLDEALVSKSHFDVVEISDILRLCDPLNEKALLASVKTLKLMQRNEDALIRYAAYTKEYRKSMGTDYNIEFEAI